MNNQVLAAEFKKRYNRVVNVDTEEVRKNENISVVTIKYREFVFVLTEHLKDGLTEYVTVMHEGKETRLKTYLEAEVLVADKIGEK